MLRDLKMTVTPILLKELTDAKRSKWLVGYTLLLALLGLAVAYAGLGSAAGLSLTMFGRTTATLINLTLFLAPLVGVSLGAATISGERDQGTLDHLLSQPIERRELLLGKYLGLWTALFIATLAGFAPAGIIVAAFAGAKSFYSFLIFPLLAQLVISAMLGIGLLISVRSNGRAQSQTFAILVWFVFVLAYDLLLLSTFSVAKLSAEMLAVMLLLNPIDAGRVLSILLLEPDLYMLGPAGAYLIETMGVLGTAGLLLSSLATWTVAPLFIAHKCFELRLDRESTQFSSANSSSDHQVQIASTCVTN
jgi:ABC-type transport system involved in multi-copper enzyme maturation permease subunit